MGLFDVSDKFDKYYTFLIRKYLIIGFIGFGVRTLGHHLIARYLGWIVNLIVILIFVILDQVAIRTLRTEIPENGFWHGIFNMIPAFRALPIHSIAIPQFKKMNK